MMFTVYVGIAVERPGHKSMAMTPISEENSRISSSGPDKKSHEISPRRAHRSQEPFSYYSKSAYAILLVYSI